MRIRTIVGAVLLVVALAISLGSCVHLPNTATPESAAATSQPPAGSAGVPAPAATPLATLIRQRGIAPLDPASKVPLLDQAMAELAKSDSGGHFKGITYDLTQGNELHHDWLIQTPDIWNRPAAALAYAPIDCTNCDGDYRLPVCHANSDCPSSGEQCGTLKSFEARPDLAGKKMCLGQSDSVTDRWFTLIASARKTVDITLLQPGPDTRFLAALRNAITVLARSRRAVIVRVLVGQYPPDNDDANALLGQLVRDARMVPTSRLTIYAAAMRSCSGTPGCSSFSWNHSKIVAVDGHQVLTGGHNMYSRDYLDADPIQDISMELAGPAALSADHFADALWGFVCANSGRSPDVTSFEFQAGTTATRTGCLATIPLPGAGVARAGRGVPVLAVGRLASGITPDFANQGDLARDLLLGAARKTIRIVQQDIAFNLAGVPGLGYPIGVTYPESTLERVSDFLLSGGDAYVVLSSQGSVGLSTATYSNGVPLADLARKIQEVARGRSHLSDADLTALLCQHLHLAPFRFGPDQAWPDGHPIGNHGKFWMVDDHIFYIGSDNMYPVDLQEFGYVIDDRGAAATALHAYWDPLWKWSSRAAISGSEASACVFGHPATP